MSKSDLKQLERSRASGQTFATILQRMRPQIAAALPKEMNVDRMSRLAMTAFRENPKLEQCEPVSVAGAIIKLAQMGLEINVLGQGFLVPYYNTKRSQLECQGIPGWMGIVELINRAGRGNVISGAAYDGDFFDFELGSDPFVKHKPGDSHGIGELLYTYAVGKIKGGEIPVIEVWSKARLEAHRNKVNKVGEAHYSYRDWEMYARKVPLLQAAKYMPRSVELQKALEAEGAADRGEPVFDFDLEPESSTLMQEPSPNDDKGPETASPPTERKPTASKATPSDAEPAPAATEPRTVGPPSFSELVKSIAAASTSEQFDELADTIRSIENKTHKQALETMLQNKRETAPPPPVKPTSKPTLKME